MGTLFRELKQRNACSESINTIIKEDIDSDALEADDEIFDEEKQSNLWEYVGQDNDAMDAVQSVIRNKEERLQVGKFAVGKSFLYWNYYKELDEEQLEEFIGSNKRFRALDFGGHSIVDLVVYAHYDSIKEEALATGLVRADVFEKAVIQKAERYLKTKKCREMRCRNQFDDFHFDLRYDSRVQPRHLHALFLYTDFTKFSTEFSKVFRRILNESIKDTNVRNSKFAHTAQSLRELITYFGSNRNYGGKPEDLCGPFYTGMDCVLNVPEFALSLQGPTSSSRELSIAWRFAGHSGMVITLDNSTGVSAEERFVNVRWLSSFPEEDEQVHILWSFSH